MTRYILAYAGTAIAFVLLDAIWLSLTSSRIYRPLLGQILIDGVRWVPAISFYLIYLAGVILFAVAPGLRSGNWMTAAILGACLGFVSYATYDLTNQATLIIWPLQITLMDLAWGTFVTGTSAIVGFFSANLGRSA